MDRNDLHHLSAYAPLVMVTAHAPSGFPFGAASRAKLAALLSRDLCPRAPAGMSIGRKPALIADYLQRHGLPAAGNWMIGDTEADVRRANTPDCKRSRCCRASATRPIYGQAEPDFLDRRYSGACRICSTYRLCRRKVDHAGGLVPPSRSAPTNNKGIFCGRQPFQADACSRQAGTPDIQTVTK